MDLDGIGYARDLQEKRERILAIAPASHRSRILGRPAPHTRAETPKVARLPVKRRFVVVEPKRPTAVEPTSESIVTAVLEATGISMYEFLREGRSTFTISRARQLGYWLTEKLRPDMSYPERGRMFRKDHTTIMSGLKRAEAVKDSAPISEWLAHPAIAALLEKGAQP